MMMSNDFEMMAIAQQGKLKNEQAGVEQIAQRQQKDPRVCNFQTHQILPEVSTQLTLSHSSIEKGYPQTN